MGNGVEGRRETDAYSFKEVFDHHRSSTESALGRIETKLDVTAKDVSDLRVENAKLMGKMAVLMVILTGVGGTVGAVVAANILK